MSIDYSLYHPEWKTRIVPEIKEREGHACKFCRVKNYAIKDKETQQVYHLTGTTYKASEKIGLEYYEWAGYVGSPREMFTIIVLTVAHLDHDIDNNDYSNLAALCQKCHLNYDAEHHSLNSKATREAKKAAKDAENGALRLF